MVAYRQREEKAKEEPQPRKPRQEEMPLPHLGVLDKIAGSLDYTPSEERAERLRLAAEMLKGLEAAFNAARKFIVLVDYEVGRARE